VAGHQAGLSEAGPSMSDSAAVEFLSAKLEMDRENVRSASRLMDGNLGPGLRSSASCGISP
jgi:hypothetical protein